MSINEMWDINVWYMTVDYQNLYCIEKLSEDRYHVISWGLWEEKCIGTELECKLYLTAYCLDHDRYKGGIFYV